MPKSITLSYTIDYRIRTVLFGMGFGEEDFPKEIYKMSGGEKTRLALAKLLLLGPQVVGGFVQQQHLGT
ncbi:hypothetical protein, partial [Bittarella massiliensis (ex Durand et al. 2017)]